MNPFDTEIVRDGDHWTGPLRHPAQMLATQTYDDHLSVHDEANAAALGLAGAPIEGPTHFSQFDPLAHARWGDEWFRTGCISAHFTTMVVEGQGVTAEATFDGDRAEIAATRDDGAPVLSGSMSVRGARPSALDERLAARRPAGALQIVDQLHEGMRSDGARPTSMDLDTDNGALYPFSLAAKLAKITEPSAWYGGSEHPFGAPFVPMEMVSVLTNKIGDRWPIRQPSLGLFLDLEVTMLDGPLFADTEYLVEREIVGLSQSRRVESYWTRSTLTEASSGRAIAEMLLHSGVFKDSYPGYSAPPDGDA